MSLTDGITHLPGLGMAGPAALSKLGLETMADLIHHLPRRHEDRRTFKPIATLLDNEFAIVRGRVKSVARQRIRGRRSLVRAVVADDSGHIEVNWWNQPWQARNLPVGSDVVIYGRLRQGKITQPEYEVVSDEDALHVGRIVPVYPLTKGVTGPALRRAVSIALEEVLDLVEDPLPADVRRRRRLPELKEALASVHFPENLRALGRARKRFRYEELFFFELAVALQRARARKEKGIAHACSTPVDERIRARLPFRLTAAQEKSVGEIAADMAAPSPMGRLLQGDVGSGKTAVALYAALVAIANDSQVAFLAPTEVLARQHLRTLRGYLEGSRVRVELLVGSTKASERKEVLADLGGGKIDLMVGTHALLERGVEFERLGLVIVDEQHKFGVAQRAKLIRKGVRPDVLVMTATPIPRTLALTAFGDLDVSIIDELPPGRTPSETHVLFGARCDRAYEVVRKGAAGGRQSFVIFPLVEESEEIDAQAAEEGFRRLTAGPLHGLPVGLVTGRTPSAEREATMDAFRSGELAVLVGTTVLEVGLDVPNASVIVIENAERFGLSTLHQLRGRVGRRTGRSFCFLLADKMTEEARARLSIMEETHDGFRIAEEDLRLRGPGQFFGTRQHGLPDFRYANLARDFSVLKAAREDAFALLAGDPALLAFPVLRKEFRRRFLGRFELYDIG